MYYFKVFLKARGGPTKQTLQTKHIQIYGNNTLYGKGHVYKGSKTKHREWIISRIVLLQKHLYSHHNYKSKSLRIKTKSNKPSNDF